MEDIASKLDTFLNTVENDDKHGENDDDDDEDVIRKLQGSNIVPVHLQYKAITITWVVITWIVFFECPDLEQH